MTKRTATPIQSPLWPLDGAPKESSLRVRYLDYAEGHTNCAVDWISRAILYDGENAKPYIKKLKTIRDDLRLLKEKWAGEDDEAPTRTDDTP